MKAVLPPGAVSRLPPGAWAWGVLLVLLPHAFRLVGLGPGHAAGILIYGLFGAGVNLLLGYVGIASFGHALFYGTAAYVAALFYNNVARDILAATLFAGWLSGLLAVGIGFLALRKRGIYFGLITLAFSQMFFYIALRWTALTGGENGLGIYAGRQALGLNLSPPLRWYYFVAAFDAVCLVLLWRVAESPFGRTLVAIRNNKARVTFLGLNVDAHIFFAFVISGLVAGLAGGLYAFQLRFVSTHPLHWMASAQILIVVLLGGRDSFWGPLIGSLAYNLAAVFLGLYVGHWMLWLGLAFILVVVFWPDGIAGVLQSPAGGEILRRCLSWGKGRRK